MEMPKRQSSCLLTDKSNAWKCLAGIKLSSLQPNLVAEDFYEEPATENNVTEEKTEPDVYTVSNAMMCSMCDCKFEDRLQQKAHYRLDWHRFNLKQRMQGLKSISEEAFSQQAGDVSSISGSGDSSTSEDESDMSPVSQIAHPAPARRKKTSSIHKYDSDDDDVDAQKEGRNSRRCPRIYFDNDAGQVVSVYRCIIHGKREAPTNHTELLSRTLGLLTNQKWAIMMTGGGHFAAAVYDGPDVIVHKTFHRYTVRAKRGTVQSVRDSQGNAPKSAGASIRRHNEAALNQEVQELLASWKDHLDSCARIFLRVPTYNKVMFYGGKCPALLKGDNRVVTIPFATRRATFKELKRVWEILATVESHGSVEDVAAVMASPKERKEWRKGKRSPKDDERVAVKEGDTSVDVVLSRLEKQTLEDECKETSADNMTVVKMKENKKEEDDDEVDDVEFHEEIVITSTDHLKEFETTHKKPRKRKKKKQQGHLPQKDNEEENFTTELFTICRTGNMEKLEEVLQKIHLHFSIPAQSVPNSINKTKESQSMEPGRSEGISSIDFNSQTSNADDKRDSPGCVVDQSGVPLAVGNSRQSSGISASSNNREDHSGNKNSSEGRSNHEDGLDNAILEEDDHKMPDLSEGHEERLRKSDITDATNCDEANVPMQHIEMSDDTLSHEGMKEKEMNDSKNQGRQNPGFLKFLNKSLDDMGYTFLHVAAEDGQRNVLYRLMECGADPGNKNKKGKPAFGCSLDKKTREEFRRFRSDHPDRYDYERAQIPVPLTEEQEREKAAKQTERKRNARKAKRLKEKEQKEAREEERKEKEKKDWYANLSDREKRALAAEKRFAQQVTSTSDMQRCWSCGSSLSGKVPFSYMDFKFCSMPCLKKHKQQSQ